ncbi:MAG: NADH/ubiquinone/plastoquinone (complex I) [Candidatus Omnitrophica bacterium]|nr:NADH/ubiquinone/plastoquinone (complex I) [Candidatus Omnitrophota bacterium]
MFIFIVFPLVGAGIMPLLGKLSKKKWPDILSAMVLLILLVCSVVIFSPSLKEPWQYIQNVHFLNEPVHINLALDSFNGLFLILISFISFTISLFSIDYMEIYGSKQIYYALLLVIVAALNGLVLSKDLFGIYIFLESAAIASFGLVAFSLEAEALEGAYKYLLLSVIASGFILLGIVLLFAITGSLSLDGVKKVMEIVNNKSVITLCSILFIVGFGLKTALVPFHSWMPDAYTKAPATFPAISSGLIIKITGIYVLARIFFNMFQINAGVSSALLFLGMFSIIVGTFLALGQKDIKRMLAYSSISQVGYIIAGFGVGTALGVIAAIFQLFNHSIFKSLLFLNAGSLEKSTGTQSLDEMGGLEKKMPVTATTNAVGLLSTAGVPPLNGFWSKLLIIMALLQAKLYIYAIIAIFMSVLTLWYFLIVHRQAFFGKLNEKWSSVREAPFWMSLSMIILALACFVIGIAFYIVLKRFIIPASVPLAGFIMK